MTTNNESYGCAHKVDPGELCVQCELRTARLGKALSAKRAKSENIRRAERKEEEARNLLREAAYLRDLEKRLIAADQRETSDFPK